MPRRTRRQLLGLFQSEIIFGDGSFVPLLGRINRPQLHYYGDD